MVLNAMKLPESAYEKCIYVKLRTRIQCSCLKYRLSIIIEKPTLPKWMRKKKKKKKHTSTNVENKKETQELEKNIFYSCKDCEYT